MCRTSLFCNLSEFSRDKNPLINKEAGVLGAYECKGKGHSYISNFGLPQHHRHFNNYYFKFTLNLFFFLHFNSFASNTRMQMWIFASSIFYSYLVKVTRNPHPYNSTLHFSESRRRENIGVKGRGYEKRESCEKEDRVRDREIQEGLGKKEVLERDKGKYRGKHERDVQ